MLIKKKEIKMNPFEDIQAAITEQINDLLPVVGAVGLLVLGVVAAVAVWFRFGPGLVKKVFGKAS